MPNKAYQEKMFDNDLPPGTKISLNEKGYTSNQLALDWLQHFHDQMKLRRVGRYRLLIVDGFSSHLIYEFLSLADTLNIVVLYLPAHSTYLTQPLDLVCFSVEKHWHSKSIEESVHHGRYCFTKLIFLQVLRKIRGLTVAKELIWKAFHVGGIVPLDTSVVQGGLARILNRKNRVKDLKECIYC